MLTTIQLLINLLVIIIVNSVNTIDGLQCYQCTADPHIQNGPKSTTLYTCSDFDHSDKYVIDCPYSTLCLKRVQSLVINDLVTVNVTTRGCATQKSKTPTYVNGSWTDVIQIVEPYQSGCYESFVKDNRLTQRVNCYCHGDFCNYAITLPRQPIPIYCLYFVIIIVFINKLYH